VTPELIDSVVAAVPETWLTDADSPFAGPDEHRAAYVAYLRRRLEMPRTFVEEAANARAQRV
jgi:hypothetical protein